MKKILSVILTLTLVISALSMVTFATDLQLETGKTNLVSGDSSDFEGGTVGTWNAAHGGSVSAVNNPSGSGKVLKFDAGTSAQSWYAPTFNIKPIVSALSSPCTLYIAVDVYSGASFSTTARLRDAASAGSNGRWHNTPTTNDFIISNVSFVSSQWQTVIVSVEITQADITAATNAGAWNFCFDRIPINTTEFYLDNLVISDGEIKEKVVEPTVRVKLTEGKTNLVSGDSCDFEGGTKGNWTANFGGTLTAVKNPTDGGKALSFQWGDTGRSWWAPTFDLKPIIKNLTSACKLYLSLDVYSESGYNAPIRLRDTATAGGNGRWHASTTTNDKQIGSISLEACQWTTLIVSIEITAEDIVAASNSGTWLFCLDNITTSTTSFYIDNFYVSDAPIFIKGEEKGPVEFSGTFGNNMVLQRNTALTVWGKSDFVGKQVTVTFKNSTAYGTVGQDGKWTVTLPGQEADKKENDLTVSCNGESKTLTGVLVGDVYLIGGQSNAEKRLSACGSEYSKTYIESLISRDSGMIRYFAQGGSDAKAVPESMLTPQEEPLSGKKWQKETYASALNFSAMGFFFAHRIADSADVPVGMIMVCCAGSPVSQLMSAEASQAVNYTRYENNIPVSGMYNALMNPFIKTKVKAMIYYQGESEQGLAMSDYGKYNEYLNAYVEDLRTKMNQNFPFYYVQLSSHDGTGLTSWTGIAEQRAVQFDGTKVIQNSAMIVSMDYGFRTTDQDYAHPNYKEPVGNRLADLALAKLYNIGDENYVTSPYPEYAYKTSAGIVVHFHNVGSGLKVVGSYTAVKGFKAIKSGTRQYVAVDAEIIGKDEILVKTNGIAGVIGVGYGLELLGFNTYDGDEKYIANLSNSNNLPAPTFKFTTLLENKLTMGDVDGDGSVTGADRIYLSRYIALWKDYSVLTNKSVADINGDGLVNTIDRILLSRYLANWTDANVTKYFE